MKAKVKPGKAAKSAGKVPKRRVPKPRAGWLEHVDLPDLRVYGLRAKLDTGARSSALHVDNLRVVSARHVAFDVVLGEHRVRHLTALVSRVSRVKSSNGHYDKRFFITTRLRMGPVDRDIELSLVDREQMLHRMLLGRTSLKGLLVDPARRYLLEDPPPSSR